MRRSHRTRLAFSLLTAVATAGILIAMGRASVIHATQAPQLPDEARAFMERDQVRRWANLIERGDKLFNEGSCMRCHGAGGTGGQWAPDLTDLEWVQSDGSLAGIRETIFWGVRRRDLADPSRRFEMNPGGGGGMDLEWPDYDALAIYVWTRSNGTFLPS